jgi:hypothetical protein
LNKTKDAQFAVTGFTDPIGGVCANRKLADDRAQAVRTILKNIVDSNRIINNPSVVTPKADSPYKRIADDCLKTYHSQQPERERPLRGLTQEEQQSFSPCRPEPQDLVPNHIFGVNCKFGNPIQCAESYKGEFLGDATLIAMTRAANFRKVSTCLSPLRRVEIEIKTPEAAK